MESEIQRLKAELARTKEELSRLRATVSNEHICRSSRQSEEENSGGDNTELCQLTNREGQPLDNAETARWARQIVLPSLGIEGQTKLLSKSALVVGAGGLGSPVLLYIGGVGFCMRLPILAILH